MTTPPSGNGATPVGAPDERDATRPPWLIPLLAVLAVLLVALLIWLLVRDGGDDDELETAASPSATASASELPSETPEASDITTTEPTTQATSTATATASPAPAGTPSAPAGDADIALTAGTDEVFPLQSPDQDLSTFTGEVVGRSVPVESVPADEGFWLGTGPDQRVWVEIVAIEGETPFTVQPGDTVSFRGAEFVPHDETYAERLDIAPDEGGDQLTAQKAHVQVRSADLQQG
jgi:hypothetical protein